MEQTWGENSKLKGHKGSFDAFLFCFALLIICSAVAAVNVSSTARCLFNASSPIWKVYRSVGTKLECMEMLNERNMYFLFHELAS
jgi:hypothetical protein